MKFLSRLDDPGDSGSSFACRRLVEIFEEDRPALAALLDAALLSIGRDLAAIERAAGGADVSAIVAAAHRLKGTSGSIGAQRLVAIGSWLEGAATPGHGTATPELVRELREAVAAVRRDVGAFKRSSRERAPCHLRGDLGV